MYRCVRVKICVRLYVRLCKVTNSYIHVSKCVCVVDLCESVCMRVWRCV